MSITNKPPHDKYNALFATSLRDFMECHPDTHEKTTQKALADYLGVRPQTVSCYCTGESLPNCEQLLRIAEFFGVTCDFLMTGRRTENKPVRELLGLSENTIHIMKETKEGYYDIHTPMIMAILDGLLGEPDFYLALEKAAVYEGLKEKNALEDYVQFLEWKQSEYVHSFMMEFFSSKLPILRKRLIERGELEWQSKPIRQ
jgi:transcriptional regulator with XRE-family HTH domain